KAPAIFDFEKLKWMNHKYILDKDLKELCKDTLPYLSEAYGISECNEKALLIIDAVRGNMNFTKDVKELATPFFKRLLSNMSQDDLSLIKDRDALKTFEYVIEKIDEVELEKNALDNFLNGLKDALQIPGKKIYHPLRVALFYSRNGPELWKIFLILGKDEVKGRLQEAINLVKQSIQE
ncbi:MAG: glutamate--tRNA ligase, partial [Caldisericum sp.]|nr:glutamate--tRNA ligase [Caldisericum sp.]